MRQKRILYGFIARFAEVKREQGVQRDSTGKIPALLSKVQKGNQN